MKLKVESRSQVGSRQCRRLRQSGYYPAVVYGYGKPSRSFQVSMTHMDVFMKSHPVKSQIFSIELEKDTMDVLVRDIRRSTSTNQIQHIDFFEISKNKELVVNVPFSFSHEADAVGVREGGVIDHVMTEIAIKVLPKNLPENILVDIETLEIGQSIHLSALTLPKGCVLDKAISEDYDPLVVSIHAPKVVVEEDVETAEGDDNGSESEEAEQTEGADGEDVS